MQKIKQTLLIAAAGLIYILATGIANAGILDTVKDTITGHVDDIKSRFDKDRPSIEIDKVIKKGKIDEDAIGQDFLHNSKGSVGIIESDGKYYLYLSDNFNSSPGPDYHVYISYEDKIYDESGWNESEQIELGKLKYGNGMQFYEIPDHVDVTKIKSFLLWCKAFGAYIGSADLN